MRNSTIGLLALMMFLGGSLAAEKEKTYTGEIMDSTCAKMGSHNETARAHRDIRDARNCTLACIDAGGAQFVLYDAATKTIYQLDDQRTPREFAAQEVKVMGTLDAKAKTIRVTNIEAVDGSEAGQNWDVRVGVLYARMP